MSGSIVMSTVVLFVSSLGLSLSLSTQASKPIMTIDNTKTHANTLKILRFISVLLFLLIQAGHRHTELVTIISCFPEKR